MTTIAFKIEGNTLHASCDSQSTGGQSANYLPEDSAKIFQPNKNLTIGVAGYAGFNPALVHTRFPEMIDINSRADVKAYVNNKLRRTMMLAFKEYDPTYQGEPVNIGLIVGISHPKAGHMLFEVGCDFYFSPREDYATTGSGGTFAEVVLANGGTTEQAVHVAKQHDLFTGGPIRNFKVEL